MDIEVMQIQLRRLMEHMAWAEPLLKRIEAADEAKDDEVVSGLESGPAPVETQE